MPDIGMNLQGNSPLFEYPLGQCLLFFKGYLLGKTTSDTILKTDRDIKDILFSQDGTKPSDWVNTGELYSIDVTLGETKDELISLLDKSWIIDRKGNALLDRDLYESYKENRSGTLKLVKVDGNGQPIQGDEYQFNFYQAIPVVNGELMQFGADTQKNFPLTINFGYKIFAPGESSTRYGGYGYIGDPVELDVPAVEWPPIVQSATTDDVTMTITFDKNIALDASNDPYTAGITINVDGVDNAVTAGVVIATTTITITLLTAGVTIAAGDIVKVDINENTIKGADNTEFMYVNDYPVTNTAT